jgi:hypothetical protein
MNGFEIEYDPRLYLEVFNLKLGLKPWPIFNNFLILSNISLDVCWILFIIPNGLGGHSSRLLVIA